MAKRQLTPREEPVLAIDPGRTESAIVAVCGDTITGDLLPNRPILDSLRCPDTPAPPLIIERMNFMRAHAGDEVHETNVWAGRFLEAYGSRGNTAVRIYRDIVKVHICGGKGTDADVRAALIDRYGGKEKAIGGVRCKKCKGKGWTGRHRTPCDNWMCEKGWLHPPGPLKQVVTHCWQALALGLAYLDGVELAND